MTQYIYKGKEISHLDFISIMRNAGISGSYRESHYAHLQKLASKGNQKAQDILNDLQVKD